jgi:hypothetical protein
LHIAAGALKRGRVLALLILRAPTRQQHSQGCFCDKAWEGRKQSNGHVSQAHVPGAAWLRACMQTASSKRQLQWPHPRAGLQGRQALKGMESNRSPLSGAPPARRWKASCIGPRRWEWLPEWASTLQAALIPSCQCYLLTSPFPAGGSRHLKGRDTRGESAPSIAIGVPSSILCRF